MRAQWQVIRCTRSPPSQETSVRLHGGYLSGKEREDITFSILRLLRDSQENKQAQPKLDFFKLDPEYLPQLVEIIWGLVNQPLEFRALPRYADFVCYEYILKDKSIEKDELEKHLRQNDTLMLTKLLKDILEFYLDTSSVDKSMFQEFLQF